MGLQKYRADKQGETYPNGSVPWYVGRMGGSSLGPALIRNCPVVLQFGEGLLGPFKTLIDGLERTAYITGEPDSFFSQPAAIKYLGKRVNGYITQDENGFQFRARLK